MRGQVTKNKNEVFQFIESKGGDEAIINFSGGNDEGGVDGIQILKNGQSVCMMQEEYETSVFDGQKWTTVKPTNPDYEYIKALVAPVYEKYHSFAGDFYVDGQVRWNCKEKTCKMDGSETLPSTHGFEDDF